MNEDLKENTELTLDHKAKSVQVFEKARRLEKSKKNRIWFDEDTQLLMKALKGDRCAYNSLYKKYRPVVVCFIANLNGDIHSSEDIAQKVFYRIWNKEIEFKGESSVKTFLLSVARYVLSEHKRQEGKEFTVRQNLISNRNTNFSSTQIQTETIDSEDIQNVNKAIGLLSDKQRQAIELIYNMKLTPIEAAKITNCTEKAFESCFARAHKKLRQILKIF